MTIKPIKPPHRQCRRGSTSRPSAPIGWKKAKSASTAQPINILFISNYQSQSVLVPSPEMSTDELQQERRILVAVDDGDESAHALQWCLEHVVNDAPGTADAIVLLYVVPPGVVYTSMNGTGYLFSKEVIESMEKYSKEVADSVLDRSKAVCSHLNNVKVQTRIEKGDPRDMICGMAAKLGADLLVMGSHGYGVIKRAFLGSVSNYCAQNAKCAVLVVKRPKH